jgi:RNA polymerase sigma-70 factor (ECF subfamily)
MTDRRPADLAIDQTDALRPLLIAISYRITGSRSDAEDIAQETIVRWLKADRSLIRSPRAFLTTVATRLSLNHLRDRKARREDYVGDWLPEPVDTSSDRDLAEISFGFMILLERLAPLQRAVFVLRSAFECDYDEIAAIVGRDNATCRKIFSRARRALQAERPLRPIPAKAHAALLDKFLATVTNGDLKGLAAILADEVVMRGDGGPNAPALKKPLTGAEPVARFIVASRELLPKDARLGIEMLNGAPAAVFRARGRVVIAILIECAGDRIARVFALANPEKLNRAGEA